MNKKDLPSPNNFNNIRPNNEDYDYFEEGDVHSFEHLAKQLEPVNAWRLADSAFLAYTRREFAKQQFKKLGLDQFEHFSSGSTQCYVASNEEFAIITFRGTQIQDINGFEDFLIDVRLNLADSNIAGKVHNGFKDALDLVWGGDKSLLEYLKKLKEENQQITLWFTGHSLGAALAILAAGRFGNVQGLYTYGCPKVGNYTFTKDFPIKSNIYRFVNNNDITPDLPLTEPIFSQTAVRDIPFFGDIPIINETSFPFLKLPEQYYQLGELVYFKKDGSLANRPDNLEHFFDRFIGIWENLTESALNIIQLRTANFPDSFADHAPIYYSLHTRNHFIEKLP